MPGSRKRSDLAQFLRSRRERITPAEVGLPAGPRRRTPGLRREEIAVLAGLSPTWYAYLEQGRDINPSPEVLDSLARVLQLSPEERRYLHLLASDHPPSAELEDPGPADEQLMRQVVEAMGRPDYPVYAGNLYGDITAWNGAAERWYTDFGALPSGRRNMLWWLLTAREARDRIVDWEDDTRDVIGRFRIAFAGRPWDPRFPDLITAMRRASPEFRKWWSEHDVRDQQPRVRRIRLPTGDIQEVRLAVLRMADGFNSVVLHVPVTDLRAEKDGGATRASGAAVTRPRGGRTGAVLPTTK